MGTVVVAKKNSSVAIAAHCCNVCDTEMRAHLNISHGCVLHFGESYIGLNASVGFQQAFEELVENWVNDAIPALDTRHDIRHFF